MRHRTRSGAIAALAGTLFAALAGVTPAIAQYAGSNVTGSSGVIAIDKVADKIRFYDPVTLALTKTIDPPAKGVHELAISYDHKWAFVPLYGLGIYGANPDPNNKVLIVDLARQAVAGMIDLGDAIAPHGLIATRDGKLWVVCDRQNKLLLIDPAARSVEAIYQVPGKGAHFVVSLPDGSRLYISNKEGPIAVFDVRTRRFLDSIPVAAGAPGRGDLVFGVGSEGLTPTPDGRHVLAVDNDRGDIRVIDTAGDRQSDRVPLAGMPLTNPKRSRLVKLMFSPDRKYLVATAYAGGMAWIIDAADYRRQVAVPVAKGPQGIAFPPDGRSVIVASHDDGILTRIDLRSKTPLSSVDGGGGTEVLAFY